MSCPTAETKGGDRQAALDVLPKHVRAELTDDDVDCLVHEITHDQFGLFCTVAPQISQMAIPPDQELLVSVSGFVEFGVYRRASESGAAHRLIISKQAIYVFHRDIRESARFTFEDFSAALALFKSHVQTV